MWDARNISLRACLLWSLPIIPSFYFLSTTCACHHNILSKFVEQATMGWYLWNCEPKDVFPSSSCCETFCLSGFIHIRKHFASFPRLSTHTIAALPHGFDCGCSKFSSNTDAERSEFVLDQVSETGMYPSFQVMFESAEGTLKSSPMLWGCLALWKPRVSHSQHSEGILGKVSPGSFQPYFHLKP